MTRDSRYDILFEPVKIGRVTSRNRFFQVPHCNGMGTQYPRSQGRRRLRRGLHRRVPVSHDRRHHAVHLGVSL